MSGLPVLLIKLPLKETSDFTQANKVIFCGFKLGLSGTLTKPSDGKDRHPPLKQSSIQVGADWMAPSLPHPLLSAAVEPVPSSKGQQPTKPLSREPLMPGQVCGVGGDSGNDCGPAPPADSSGTFCAPSAVMLTLPLGWWTISRV